MLERYLEVFEVGQSFSSGRLCIVHLYDTGHFALETHVNHIAAAIRDFLGRHL